LYKTDIGFQCVK